MNPFFHTHKDALTGGIWLTVAVAIFWYAGTFPELEEGYPGPSLFPRLIAMGLGLSGLGLMVQAWRSPRTSPHGSPERAAGWSWLRLLAALLMVTCFPWLRTYLGFVPALSLVVGGMALLLRVKPLPALLVAVGASGLIYLLFTYLLSVPL